MSDYEKDKQAKKQLLVRNEFLYFGQSDGKYDIPIIHKQSIDVDKINFLSYVDAKNNANINGRLLKDIWDEVSFAGYMYCGRPEDY